MINPWTPDGVAAPTCLQRPFVDTRHGVTRTDEYHWLRAENWQAMFRDPSLLDPVTRAHLEAENAYQEALMADTKDLRANLVAEMRGRIKEDDASVPLADGPYAYGVSFAQGGQHRRFIRVPREGGPEEMLLDGDKQAEGTSYFRFGGVDHSPDHRFMLWSADTNGSEFYPIRVRDLLARADLQDLVETTNGDAAWASDSQGFFYTRLDDNHRPYQVLFHRIGAPPSEDVLVHEEEDSGFFTSIGRTRDGAWIVIGLGDHETGEVRLLPARSPAGGEQPIPVIVEPRAKGVEYSLEEGGDEFFVLTNADGAKDFKIMVAPAHAPSKANWAELVPHIPGRLILAITSFRTFLVRLERENGLPRIVVRERVTGEEHVIAFPEDAYSLGLGGTYEYDTELLRFTYSSMTTPASEFEYNLRTRERVLLKTQEVPSGHDPARYVTRRLMAPSHDGELVPVSLLYRADTPLDGSAPCLLYGYGAYGITIPAGFNTDILSLVDRGFVYAIAHIRGGKDKGYGWYEAGKREGKANTFHDFIAAGRHLVREGLTSHDRIVAQGGSAGGMLMGAIANMAPEEFAGIVAQVPFVDVLSTMLDDTLPLTPPEWPEWGNPIASEEDYRRIASYSPYDNVAAKPYPAIFALAGLTDPRVTYWEPAKWVARLRAHTTAGNPILLKVNMAAGHGGASGRFARLEEVALVQAFALKVAGRAA
ncbi:S9 family peptidase [Rubellimicrobium rubrum]|uniref:S9 family peptidase n=1 Tax=Rubellimicrobium rubrum TaxID=2585369 RepID=A0A5C4N2L2_9RHOB|nr:S9 family peptidase [Rubellimicrobium rubrum]TNC51624.1 S9 family peptidase [Rubellimicrobium rubrum]